jgi:hypothetical protein
VRTLVEAGVLVGEPGAFRLARLPDMLQMPVTVQAILAARIDRLPPDRHSARRKCTALRVNWLRRAAPLGMVSHVSVRQSK